MDKSNPAMHLRLKLKHNKKVHLSKGDTINDPFFANIDTVQKKIVEKCKNKRINERVFPLISDIDEYREINYRPFNKAIELSDSTILPDDDNASYIIDNLNTDWALSAVEQLTNIYKEVTVYRLYTHFPFKIKVVVQCKTRLNNSTGPLTESVLNKINLDELYAFMRYMQEWAICMITVAETGEETFVSHDTLYYYLKLISDLLDDL